MSKYVNFQTKFTDGKLLIEALAAMGLLGIQNHIGNPQRLEGFQGDRRSNTADIVIPRHYVGSASNDLGFRRNAQGSYDAIISEYDQHRYNHNWLNKLNVEYAEADLKAKAKKAGFKLVNTGLKENGNRKYTFQQA